MNLEIINSEGESLILPQNDKLILQQWDGFATPSHSLVTDKAPDQIGSTVINKVFDSRTINIDFVINAENKQEVFNLRREVLRILNPIYDGGILKWTQNDDITYQIGIELENLQMPGGDGQGKTFQLVQLSFLAEDPRWFDENITTVNLNINETTSFTNTGDTKTDFEITINGPIVNPVITNVNNGQKIRINYNLLTNEKIIINTKFGNKNVKVVSPEGKESRALNILDLESELFYLGKKTNSIEVEGQGVNADTSVKIEFYNRYIGM
jgi:hypothetical protein